MITVTGSDVAENYNVKRLREKGHRITLLTEKPLGAVRPDDQDQDQPRHGG